MDMSSCSKGGPHWGPASSTLSHTITHPQEQQHRRQTWASVTWATGQSIISGIMPNSKKDFAFGDHNRSEYHTFRDEVLLGPPAYDSIVSPRVRPGSSRRQALPSRQNSQAQPQSRSSWALPSPTRSSPASAPPPPPATAPRQQALELPPLPRLLGLDNLDEWDDMLTRTLRLHGLAQYINPGVPEPEPSPSSSSSSSSSSWGTGKSHQPPNTLTHAQWTFDRAAVCLLIIGSLSSDVRDTLSAYGYDHAAEENPKALHDLVLEALPKAAGEDVSSWMRELSGISPAERRFESSLREFCLRVGYLRRRLHQAEPQPNDNLVLVMAVLGLARAERYEGLSMTLGRELERGALTWARLMGDLAGVHGREVRERRETGRE
ncbi:unnamed protein product [Discula destructiva]